MQYQPGRQHDSTKSYTIHWEIVPVVKLTKALKKCLSKAGCDLSCTCLITMKQH